MKHFANKVADRHAHMVDDPLRSRPLVRAIEKSVKKNSIVVDIGTGLGLLAITAAKVGAKHVCAIDLDAEALGEAFRNAGLENVKDKITFIEGLSFNVKIPKLADIVICETVGSFGFDENILATLADAKKRLLKKKGKIIPNKLELWGAPCKILPKLDAISETAQIKKGWLLSYPSRLFSVNFNDRIPKSVHTKRKFRCKIPGTIRAIAVWPKVFWSQTEITVASPFAKLTHWKQGILPIEPRRVARGETVSLELIIKPHPKNPLMMTERLWRWV